jgi:hypothetical protein
MQMNAKREGKSVGWSRLVIAVKLFSKPNFPLHKKDLGASLSQKQRTIAEQHQQPSPFSL